MPAHPLIKICGGASAHDLQLAEAAGADYSGIIVDHLPSPRNVALAKAAEMAATVATPIVAVTVNKSLEELLRIHELLHPAVFQLHGDEPPELIYALKERGFTVWAVASGDSEAVRQRAHAVVAAGADAVLVDARQNTEQGVIYGGTGHTSDWNVARELVDAGLRVVLAGGLGPENVAEAITQVRPWMVDVISGIEASKGVKDPEKLRRFVEAVRNNDGAG